MRIPDRATARLFARNYLLLGLAFFLVYGGTNYLTAIRSEHYRLFFDWESQIPFVPGFVYVYLSIFLVFLLPLFYLDRQQIRALSAAFMIATCFAGVVYLLLPAELYFERPQSVPGHEFVFKWLYKLALPHNLFPSLHVIYASLFIGVAVTEESSGLFRGVLAVWWLFLIVSVFLVRQHQFLDVIAGILVALLCYRLVYRRAGGRIAKS